MDFQISFWTLSSIMHSLFCLQSSPGTFSHITTLPASSLSS